MLRRNQFRTELEADKGSLRRRGCLNHIQTPSNGEQRTRGAFKVRLSPHVVQRRALELSAVLRCRNQSGDDRFCGEPGGAICLDSLHASRLEDDVRPSLVEGGSPRKDVS